MMIILGPWETA